MKALIIEDEEIASVRLNNLIHEVAPDVDILATISSVESGIAWFKENAKPDLIFLDIQLNDGYGFDILDEIVDHPPTIFTTAYNEYAVRGFKYNGIDYLLKPIDKKELRLAIEKFRKSPYVSDSDEQAKISGFKELFNKQYKHRFMVKVGNHFSTFNVSDIAYFKSEDGTTCILTQEGRQYPVEYTLDQLEAIINPIDFFRINRKYLMSLKAVQEIHNYFNSRLSLVLSPKSEERIIVSRDRCTQFKKWLDM